MSGIEFPPQAKVRDEDSEAQSTEKKSTKKRFNEAVVEKLTEEFERSQDVRNLYFTHAFPLLNLSGIVSQGGLRTGSQLRKRGVKYNEGSGGPAPTKICFNKGFIQPGYSTQKEEVERGLIVGGAVLLVPQQEYHRARRIWKETKSSGLVPETRYLDPNEKSAHEYRIQGESYGEGTELEDTKKKVAERVVASLLEKKQQESQEELDKSVSTFNEAVASLGLSDIPTNGAELIKINFGMAGVSPEGVIDTTLAWECAREHANGIAKLLAEIAILDGQIIEQTRQVDESTKQFEQDSLHSKNRIDGLKPEKWYDYLSILVTPFATLAHKKKVEGAEATKMVQAAEEKDKEKHKLDELEQERRRKKESQVKLEKYQKLLSEFSTKVSGIRNDYCVRYDAVTKKFAIPIRFADMPEGTKKIRESLRRMEQEDEKEAALRIELARSVILVEETRLVEVLEAIKAKPVLESRILICGNLEYAFNILCKTQEGIELLGAAQTGKKISSHVEGVSTLSEFLEKQALSKAA